MAWTTLTFAYGSLLTSTKMTQLYDNFTALAQGLSGAPVILQAAIDNAAVGQGELKTTTGTVSTVNNIVLLTLPGGEYGFYPQLLYTGTANTAVATLGGSPTTPFLWTTSYATHIAIGPTTVGTTCYAQQRYVQASPPYDLGDGEIPMFIFCIMNADGTVGATYAAPEAPWHHNGPTIIRPDRYSLGRGYRSVRQIFAEHGSIKAALLAGLTRAQIMDRIATDPVVDVEITQAIKNADMPLIPHPFIGNNLTGKTVVMIDPVAPLMQRALRIQESGENLSELIRAWLNIGNTALSRITPPGVIAVSASLK